MGVKPKGLLNTKVSLGQPKTCNFPWGLCQALQEPEMLWHLLLAHGQVRVARCHVSAEPREQPCGIEKDPLFKGHILHLAGLGELSKATKDLLNQEALGTSDTSFTLGLRYKPSAGSCNSTGRLS